MRIIEFGKKEKPIIVLIHGFESMYQIWDEYIYHYQDKYHIIVPILPSHDKENQEEFESIQKTTDEIIKYILKYNTNIYAIYGMSMGGVFAFNIAISNNVKVEKLILDGTPLLGYSKILKKALIRNYLNITKKAKERDVKTIKKAVKTIVTPEKLYFFLDMIGSITDTSIIKYIEELSNYRVDLSKLTSKLYYFHGTKINELLSKKVSNYLSKQYQQLKIIKFNKKSHCEIAIFNPKLMIKHLDEILD